MMPAGQKYHLYWAFPVMVVHPGLIPMSGPFVNFLTTVN
ncbi:MAG: Hypothetical protein AJITA_00999 [Acetilactobacillus jinshanensis]